MSLLIVKLGGRYVFWSTERDAPASKGMSREEVEAWTKEELGNEGLRELPRRLERVDRTGSSSIYDSLAGLVACNRAGPGESRLTLEQLAANVEHTEGCVARNRAAGTFGVMDNLCTCSEG